ncbi:uncharacterized protein CTRU02_209389 [Colletotrichum truncatum]|uniref:Uncharacterized protein n=1 Tax=Colletotrichum truncatum TaxID=5467 RepID=A0ACC3YS97_COLTU|nr:uncharacterized protein CTRU02_08534 [Colletotrichum truncatum]KAF6789835.1 hypothetical protein CTRU02_08534 [Colletotrichum truncatum]
MHFSTVLTAAATLAAGVEGYLYTVGLPKTIKPGDVFNATVTTGIMQPRQEVMIWGLTRYDREWNSGPYPGSIGTEFARTNLREVLKGTYNDTIPGLKIPESTVHGDYGIQAVILQWSGVTNTPSLETWFWDVTVGDSTSEERVWSDFRGEKSRSCWLQ